MLRILYSHLILIIMTNNNSWLVTLVEGAETQWVTVFGLPYDNYNVDDGCPKYMNALQADHFPKYRNNYLTDLKNEIPLIQSCFNKRYPSYNSYNAPKRLEYSMPSLDDYTTLAIID